MRDWMDWHAAYDDPGSQLSARLRQVQALLAQAIDRARPGPVRLVSLCAGQGRDVIGVLPEHPRRRDVSAVLVESDPRNAEVARRHAAEAGLDELAVREADASRSGNFADVLPADVLLLCGIFGNISASDIQRTVTAAAGLCAAGATVLWTRHRRPPDLTPRIRDWFKAAGFEELAFKPIDISSGSVGASRLPAAGPVLLPDEPLFRFEK